MTFEARWSFPWVIRTFNANSARGGGMETPPQCSSRRRVINRGRLPSLG
jgi:hypothetical protein